MMNASINALLEMQKSVKYVTDELDIKNKQDIVNMIKETRAERSNIQIRIMLNKNIFISMIIFPNKRFLQMLEFIIQNHTLVLSSL